MNYRNAKYLENGWIDCEIEHPTYGWIPFTCNPDDTGTTINVAELHATMKADSSTAAYVAPVAPVLTAAEKIAIHKATRDSKVLAYKDMYELIIFKKTRGNTLSSIENSLLDWIITMKQLTFPTNGTEPSWPPAPIPAPASS